MALSEAQKARLVLEYQKRQAAKQAVDFDALSFEAQRKFIEDPARLVAACTGRQAGKTDGVALKMLRTALGTPRVLVPYITLSRPSAKRFMWPKLQEWDRKLGLGASWNGTDLTMTLQNGSRIVLGGANDEAEIERYRGITIPLACIDEAQAFRGFLEYLIMKILRPATWALRGQIVMTGTPNATAMGYFARATNPDGRDFLRGDSGEPTWSIHRWNGLDNPHVPQGRSSPEDLLEQWREEWAAAGQTRDDPGVQREYFGLWTRDEEGLVYRIPDRALVDRMPDGEWEYHLGVDIGHVDETAFVVVAHDRAQRLTVIVGSYAISQAIPATIHAEVDRIEGQYSFVSQVMDPGGGGKLIVEERNRMYGGRFQVAQKQAKHAFIEMLNGDLRAGRLLIIAPNNERLLEQSRLLQWDYGRTLKGMDYLSRDRLRIDERTPDDFLDAMLYGWRAATGPAPFDEREPPKDGTPEWWAAERQRLLEKKAARVQGENEGPWWMM